MPADSAVRHDEARSFATGNIPFPHMENPMTKSSILALASALVIAAVAHAAAPAVSAIDAITAVEQQSGGPVVAIDQRGQNGGPACPVQAQNKGSKLDFLVDGRSGKVSPMTGSIASVTSDATEAGEGPNDADSGNEDAN